MSSTYHIPRPQATTPWSSQVVGYLKDDTLPKLGDSEGAFLTVRAALHDILTGTYAGKTWLKKKYDGIILAKKME